MPRREQSPPPPYTEASNLAVFSQTPPPSYSQLPPPYTEAPSRNGARQTSAVATMNRTFSIASIPGVITATWPKEHVNSEINLGETADKVLFRITKGGFGPAQPLSALYIGPGALAMGLLTRSEIMVPTDEGGVEIHTPKNRNERSVVRITSKGGIFPMRYRFRMAVGRGADIRFEDFEWRRSRGYEVRGIHPHGYGYKLVRLGAIHPCGGLGGRDARPFGETSGGREVVAIWVTNDDEWLPGRKPFQFQLLNSGGNGKLGKYFSFVALMSALRIWSIYDSKDAVDRSGRSGRHRGRL